MSSFKGTYFQYNVALEEPSIRPDSFQSGISFRHAATSIVTAEAQTGSISNFVLKGFSISGVLYDATNKKLIISQTGTGGSLGKYLIECSFDYANASLTPPVSGSFDGAIEITVPAASANVEADISEEQGCTLTTPSVYVVSASLNGFVPDASLEGKISINFSVANGATAWASGEKIYTHVNSVTRLLTFDDPIYSVDGNVGKIQTIQLATSLATQAHLHLQTGSAAEYFATITKFDITSIKFSITKDDANPVKLGQNGKVNLGGVTIVANCAGTDGASAPITGDKTLTIALASAQSVDARFLDNGYLLAIGSSGLSLTLSTASAPFPANTALTLSASKLLPIYVTADSGVYELKLADIQRSSLASETGGYGIDVFVVHADLDRKAILKTTGDNTELLKVQPVWEVYASNIISSGLVLDVNADGAFTIPFAEDGSLTKRVRISDLVAAIDRLENSSGKSLDLIEKRLHAVEVGVNHLCSSDLVDGESAEAIELRTIKETYGQL